MEGLYTVSKGKEFLQIRDKQAGQSRMSASSPALDTSIPSYASSLFIGLSHGHFSHICVQQGKHYHTPYLDFKTAIQK
jgi:hypothetical protein